MSAEQTKQMFDYIPTGWDCIKLIDCTTDGNISYGIVQPGQHTDEGIPIIRVNNVNSGQLLLDDVLKVAPSVEKKYNRTRLAGGEVLLTLVGSTGQSFIAPKELAGWNVPRAIAVIRPQIDIGANWINICLQSKPVQHFLDIRANTTVQKTLNLKDVRNIPIPIPPESIKERIESIAIALQNKIELNRQVNKTLEQMAQAIFKSWFVDFEPVTAKILAKKNGQDPERAAMRAISGKSDEELDKLPPDQLAQLTATAALFPDELVDSELGLIPKGWEVSHFDSIAKNIRIGANPKDEPPETPYVGLEHIKKKHIYLTSWGWAEQVDSNKSKFIDGDFLFGKLRPYFHKVCMVSFEGISSTDILVIRAKQDVWRGFVQFLLFDEKFVEYTNVRSTGTRMPRANWKDMAQYLIAKPSYKLVAMFDEIVFRFNMMATENIQQSQILTQLRDTLLPKLLSGEISVVGARERLTEAV